MFVLCTEETGNNHSLSGWVSELQSGDTSHDCFKTLMFVCGCIPSKCWVVLKEKLQLNRNSTMLVSLLYFPLDISDSGSPVAIRNQYAHFHFFSFENKILNAEHCMCTVPLGFAYSCRNYNSACFEASTYRDKFKILRRITASQNLVCQNIHLRLAVLSLEIA